MKTSVNKVFEIEEEKGQYDYIFISNSEINDKEWKLSYGEVQQTLDELQSINDGSGKRICFDLTKCIWADPTPLMSLSISIARFCMLGNEVTLKLNAVETDSEKSKRFLKFIAKEGFIDLLVNQVNRAVLNNNPEYIGTTKGNVSCLIGNENLSDELFLKLKTLNISLKLKRAFCLPSQLIAFNRPEIQQNEKLEKEVLKSALDQIDQAISYFISNYINIVLVNEVPAWAQAGLTYRIHMFCREALHNAVEHAYINDLEEQKVGFAVLYIRFRQGIYGSSQFEANSIKSIAHRESFDTSSKVPRLDFNFINHRYGFFEVFVVDGGQGITFSDNELKQQGSLNGVMWKLLKYGFSRKPERTTKYGGLHLVRELIDLARDYVRVYDNNQWWGKELPLPENAGQAGAIETKVKNYYAVKGVAWCLRFSWLEKPLIESNSNWMTLSPDKQMDFLNAFSIPDNLDGPELHFLLDKRISGVSKEINPDIETEESKLAFVFPSSGWMKNRIQRELKEYAKKLQPHSTLIIGDINPFEAHTYVAAIKEAIIFNYPPLEKIDHIILITTSLRVKYLTRKLLSNKNSQYSGLDFNKSATINYLNNTEERNDPKSSLLSYLMRVRYFDSKRIWDLILPSTEKSDNVFCKALIKESVRWNQNINLSHFLDFVQLLSVPMCRTILTISLERVLSLFESKSIVFRPLDTLTEGIVSVFNTKEHLEYNDNPLIVFIGSIQVTGTTVKNKVKNQDKFVVFQFFQHPDGPSKGKHLFGWPEIDTEIEGLNSYRRVGDTPMIAKGGWKYYNLPRYDDNNVSLYVQRPTEFYNTIQVQSRPLMKLGHWEYGANHDFMTINLIAAFDSELDAISILAGSQLASFIYLHLFRIFNLNLKQLSTRGKEIFRRINPVKIPDNKQQYYLPKKPVKNPPIFLYISHIVTDHILEQFMRLIVDGEKIQQIQSSIVPIVSLRMNRSGSTLCLSGLTIEKIESIVNQKLEEGLKTNAVLFDDAVISGRTQDELKSLLKNQGIENIYSIFFLDRQRLPSADYMLKGDHSCFWRLDLPIMGSSKSCTLCSGLEKVDEISKAVLSPFLRRRINEWKSEWGPKNPAIQWGGAGINPLPVNMKTPKKKYCIDIDFTTTPPTTSQKGGVDNLIEIKNTAGLISWISELHAMTSRNDLLLTLIEGTDGKKENFSSEVTIQIITSQILIFLNEFDDITLEKFAFYLLKSMFEITTEDKHTSIAAITLLVINEIALYSAVEAVLKEKGGIDIFSLNLDLQIILAIASDRISSGEGFSSTISNAKLLMKPKDIGDNLWRFHIEVTDVRGKSHTSPLNRLIQVSGNEVQISYHKIFLTIEFLTNLFESDILRVMTRKGSLLLKGYHNVFNPGSKDNITIKYSDATKYILERLGLLKTKLDLISDPYKEQDLEAQIRPELVSITSDLLDFLRNIHSQIFYPLRLDAMNSGKLNRGAVVSLVKSMNLVKGFGDSFKDIVSNFEKEYKFLPIVGLNDLNERQYRGEYERYKELDFQEVYVLWNAQIMWIFENIFSNIKHTNGTKIKNPWDTYENRSLEEAHMWINSSFNECVLQIEFQNFNLSDSKKSQMNLERVLSVLKDYGGDYRLENGDDQIFKTIIELPLAHSLKMEDYCGTN